MTGRGRTLVIDERENTFVMHGFQAAAIARGAGVRVIFNGVAGGFVGDLSRLPDLLAHLEHRHIAVTVERAATDVPAPGPLGRGDDQLENSRGDQLALFGGDAA